MTEDTPFPSGGAMTAEQISHARHALGLPNSRRKSYRNHFVTGEGSTDYEAWQGLVAMGLAKRRKGSVLSGGDDIFWLTREGAEAVLERGEQLDAEDFPVAARVPS